MSQGWKSQSQGGQECGSGEDVPQRSRAAWSTCGRNCRLRAAGPSAPSSSAAAFHASLLGLDTLPHLPSMAQSQPYLCVGWVGGEVSIQGAAEYCFSHQGQVSEVGSSNGPCCHCYQESKETRGLGSTNTGLAFETGVPLVLRRTINVWGRTLLVPSIAGQ